MTHLGDQEIRVLLRRARGGRGARCGVQERRHGGAGELMWRGARPLRGCAALPLVLLWLRLATAPTPVPRFSPGSRPCSHGAGVASAAGGAQRLLQPSQLHPASTLPPTVRPSSIAAARAPCLQSPQIVCAWLVQRWPA